MTLPPLTSSSTVATGGPVARFSEALHRFATALDEEANLRPGDVEPVRRSLARGQQVIADATRALEAEPAIERLELGRPVFIIGFLRTGSTLLHNLLGRHEDLHSPLLWELAHPVETSQDPGAHEQLRRQAQDYVEEYYRKAPDLPSIHFIDAGLPDECHRLLANTFHSMVLEMRYRVPSYGDWLQDQDLVEPYRWHRKLLQLLMSAHRRDPHERDGQRGRDRTTRVPTPVLKCPFHGWFLRDLAEVYPEARFIHLHRNPVEVVASTASLCRTVRGARSDQLDLGEIGALWSRRIATLSAELADDRNDLIGDRPVLDLPYRQLVADPFQTLRQVCEFLGVPYSPAFRAGVAEHLAQHPANVRGRHSYSTDEFGLSAESILRSTASYRKRFAVEPQP